jgi:hypothetical protein
MTEPVEVAIESALLSKAQAFAAAQSPALAISLPNIAFTPPAVSTSAKYLRASFMPAPSIALGISNTSNNQHYGFMQLDVFYGQGAGEYAPGRIASAIIAYFPRGLKLVKDGTTTQIIKQAYRGPMLKDDPWMMIPVTIPYVCFATPA